GGGSRVEKRSRVGGDGGVGDKKKTELEGKRQNCSSDATRQALGHVRRCEAGIGGAVEQRFHLRGVHARVAGDDRQYEAGCLFADLDDQDDAFGRGGNGMAAQRADLVRLTLWRVVDQAIGRLVRIEKGYQPFIGVRHQRLAAVATTTSISTFAPSGSADTPIVVRAG